MQATLAAQGLPTLLEDEWTKTLTPGITGPDVYSATLVAPESSAEDVQRALAAMRQEAVADHSADVENEYENEDDDDLDETSAAAADGEPSTAELELLGKRIRWTSLTVVLAPLAALFGATYLAGTWGRSPKPAGHALTLFALFFALVNVVAFVLVIFLAASR